jgi:hypothetical protein
MATVTSKTYEQINQKAQPYPAHLLPEGGTALALFSAGFHGWNDVIHMARKGMDVDCVDTDGIRLEEMEAVYPEAWRFHWNDAWMFAEAAAAEGKKWDVVSVDPFMGDAAEKAWKTVVLWSSLATNLVTLTVDPSRPIWAPFGWSAYLFPRSKRASWMVLHRD